MPTSESRHPSWGEGLSGEESPPPLTEGQRCLILELTAFSADTNNNLKSSFKFHQQQFHSCRSLKSANTAQGCIYLQDVECEAHYGVHVWAREAQKHPGSCVFCIWTCTHGFLTGFFATFTFLCFTGTWLLKKSAKIWQNWSNSNNWIYRKQQQIAHSGSQSSKWKACKLLHRSKKRQDW